jgi:predicted RecB family nuclease
MAVPPAITPDLAAAFWLCKRKAYLVLRGDSTNVPHEYVTLLADRAVVSRQNFLVSVQSNGLTVKHCKGEPLAGKADVFAEVLLKSDDLEALVDALVVLDKPAYRGQPLYDPHLAIGTHTVAKEDKIRLAFVGHVLSNGHRHGTQTGVIVNAAGNSQRIPLTTLAESLNPAIETLKAWRRNLPSDAPPVTLNDHCPICPFKKHCLEQAEKDDSLTLLDRMTPKLIQKYHKKGIFTITQLSYLFKPRRQRKKRAHRPTVFSLELQALALRTGKIYLHQSPSLPTHPTELFLDIEGIPDQGSRYLIGLIVVTEGRVESHSFWAETSEEERQVFDQFVQVAKQYPDAPIYHYGSYEPRALEQIAKSFDLRWSSIKDRLFNVNTLIFGKVYFPARSNTLKDLGRLLGARWSFPDSSGLQSVVWRLKWEATRDPDLRNQLSTYNLEDCHALRTLVAELRNIGQVAATRSDVDFADAPKQNATVPGQQIHDTLEKILQSAHEEYTKRRIKLRRGERTASCSEEGGAKRKRHGRRIIPKTAGKVVRVKRRLKCPNDKTHVVNATERFAQHMIVDLAFTKSGCRKVLRRYVGRMSYCPQCRSELSPPTIKRLRGRIFGHNFRAWTVYQRVILRLPYRVISQVIYDLFREHVGSSSTVEFLSDLATYYASTEKVLLKRILASPFIHVDETKLNIQGNNHYVWVLTDGLHVVFRITETREATLVQEMLKDYTGVLVSDFYGGYDACLCRQQKCLVHLIRDLNDDLWKNPYNSELEQFVGAVKDLLVPIMADVDKYGLKRWHLHKHRYAVDQFYKKCIDGREYQCEVTRTFQKRFVRYRESLFRFLDEDGIPWNNNMAERASRHLAVQRKISGSFFQRVAVHYLLLLGIAQTCRFQGKSFLAFMLSKEKDVDQFKGKKQYKATVTVGGNDEELDTSPAYDDEAKQVERP